MLERRRRLGEVERGLGRAVCREGGVGGGALAQAALVGVSWRRRRRVGGCGGVVHRCGGVQGVGKVLVFEKQLVVEEASGGVAGAAAVRPVPVLEAGLRA